jgi:hypothetical protein
MSCCSSAKFNLGQTHRRTDIQSIGHDGERHYSAGYAESARLFFRLRLQPTTKITRRLPQRDITAAAPAGAINSNARDMAQGAIHAVGRSR